mgnify:CR=1 FL=1
MVIPDSVTKIEAFAFTDCVGLTGYLYIGKGIKYIYKGAFVACNGTCKYTGSDKTIYGQEYIKNTTYYHPTCIPFSKVYCAATTPPSMYGPEGYYGKVSAELCYKDLMNTSTDGMPYVGSFTGRGFTSSEYGMTSYSDPKKHSILYVPTGSQQSYANKDNCINSFTTIVETDF